MNLTGQNVAAAFKASLFQPGQPTDTAVIAEGVVMKAGFDPVRLEAQRAAVVAMIAELQDPFFEDTGGGWSFLNLCERRDGEIWGQHQDCDALICLALALDLAYWPLPIREMWSAMPGSVPYVAFRRAPSGNTN